MSNDNVKLLPCPFCGGAGHPMPRTCDRSTPYNPGDRAFPIVRCGSCGASADGKDWKGVETAVAAWNRRAILADREQIVDRVRRLEADTRAMLRGQQSVLASLLRDVLGPLEASIDVIEGEQDDVENMRALMERIRKALVDLEAQP